MKAKADPKYITVAAAAADLGVSVATVRKWSTDGHFPIFQPPRPGPRASSPGPKLLRINREDWRRFLANNTKTESAQADAKTPSRPAPREFAGRDGVDRRRGR